MGRCMALWGVVVLGLGLVGCQSDPPKPPQSPEEAALQHYVETAYGPETPHAVQAGSGEWTLPGGSVSVSWMVPTEQSSAPLILYLPGLGEGSDAGGLWRRRWAEAGYAVVSMQALEDGPALYKTALAKTGNFRRLAREAQGAEALRLRRKLVQQVWSEVGRLRQGGKLAFAGIDRYQLVLAGFDLGTLTAVDLAGTPDGLPSPKAVMLLSPLPVAGEGPLALNSPVLTVVGALDEDPFNWTSVAQRQTVWPRIQQPNSLQLLLSEATHAALSGVPQPKKTEQPSSSKGGEGRPSRGPRQLNARGGGPGGRGGREEGGQSGGKSGGNEQSSAPSSYGAWQDPPVSLAQRVAVQAVSLAFLDSHVRHLDSAEQWLHQQARNWLGGEGSLAFR